MLPIFIVLLVIIIIGTILVVIGLQNPQSSEEKALESRLEELSKRGERVNLENLEMSRPFSERVIYPIARKMGELTLKFTPQSQLQNLTRKLDQAGNPGKLEPTMFLAIQFFGILAFGGGLALVFIIGKTEWAPWRLVLISLTFGMLGFFVPRLWLGSRIQRRQKSIRRSLPDAMDLLTICVEAGLGFDAAMAKVSQKWTSALSLAFARVLMELQLGKTRREALRDMAERIGVTELTSFVAAVIQSEQLGVSLAKVLRIQSDQMRVRRRQLAEEEAHKAPVKMVFPMGLLIFPALVLVLITPALIQLFHSSLATMFK